MRNVKRKRDRGFTLAETLVVVAIIVILLGVAAIAVPAYLRGLRQAELDADAKELFVAAQNHLTMADSQGFLGVTGYGTKEEGNDGVYWFLVGEDRSSLDDPDSLLSLMLPKQSIDDYVRGSGNYIIRYQKSPAQVLDVFYAETSGRFPHLFASGEYTTLMNDYREAEHKADRRKYGSDRSVIGYYGGVAAAESIERSTVTAPSIQIINGDRLLVTVKDTNTSQNSESGREIALKLIVAGVSSGQAREIELSIAGSSNVTFKDGQYIVVLDDITTSGQHFADLFCSSPEEGNLIPGEDLRIRAVAYAIGGTYISSAKSAEQTVNSLFDSFDASEGRAKINNIRHLENLDHEISSLDSSITLTGADQLTDLAWGGEDTLFDKNVRVYDASGSASEKGTFLPVGTSASLDYDGKDCRITGIAVRTADDAGLFGALVSGSKVRDLTLVDFDVESTGGNAGALAGTASGTDLSGILVRNEKSNTECELEITAAGDAGGLVGSFSGGKINLCAAAVYIASSDGDAGGLVGSVDGTVSLSNSYVGGHTVNARFQNDPAARAGRVNVVGGTNAGGLVGDASDASLTVKYCYSTCSAKTADGTGYVGGLIGKASSGSITDSYAAGLMVATAEHPSHPFVGNAGLEGCALTYSGNRYLNGLAENSRDIEIAGITGVNGQDTTVTDFILPEAEKTTAATYDDTLIVEYLSKYSFPVIEQLNGGNGADSKKAGISDIHYGDWQIPTLVSLNFVINNADKLEVKITREEDVNLITFSVTGQKSDITRIYLLTLSENDVALSKQGKLDETGKSIVWDPSVTAQFAIAADSEYVTIVFDDITTAGNHFCELFPDLIPGENIAVHVGSGESSWKELQQTQMVVDNSLFAKSDAVIGKANVSHIRHLQNLDPNVSKVSNQVTESKLLGNLNWDGTTYAAIYNKDSTKSVSGTFYGILNANLHEFDGDGHTIYGFVINGASADFGTDGAGNAGLFRKIPGRMGIGNVKLSEFSVESTSGNSGTLAAEITGSGVTVESVLASSASKTVIAGSSGNAGGLIGKIGTSTSGSVTVNNCAASMRVRSENGAAGGLIGLQTGGKVVVSKSYAGGHTNGFAKYETDSAEKFNVRSAANIAGGLIGGVQGGSLSVTRSFSSASVSAPDNKAAGGLIGQISAATTLDTAYAVGPVRNVKTSSDAPLTAAGAFIGQIANGITVQNTQTYYLPEVYPDTAAYVSGGTMTSSVAYLGNGSGRLSEAVKLAYYEKDGESNLISAKTYTSTMQIKTYPYDAWLRTGYGDNGGNREYPFSIWTNFSFDNAPKPAGDSTRYFGVYYGDWQPVLHSPTVIHHVTFRYQDPATGAYCGLTNDALGYQEIHEGEVNSMILPYLEPRSGYELLGWYAETDSGSVLLTMQNGLVVIPESLCGSDLTVTAKYSRLDNECSIAFFYDPTGANTNFEQIGSSVKVEKNAPLNSVVFPSRNIENCSFLGWFSDVAFQVEADPDADTPITEDLVFYAQYRPVDLLTITIDFLYQVDGGSSEHLNSVPTYRIEDQGQYKIQFENGTVFNETIPLPNIANYSGNEVTVGYYEEGNDGMPELVEHNELLTSGKSALKLETDASMHYVVIYHVTTGGSEIETYTYRIQYRMHDTAGNTTQAALAYQKGSTYSYNRYGSNIFSAPTGTIPDIKFETLEGFTRITGASDIRLEKVSGSGTDYVIYVDYERRMYTLDFDSKSGSYVDPVLLAYGQPLSEGKPANPTRTGYTFNTWLLHDKGAAEGTSTYSFSGTGANTKMPARNVRAEAKWNAGTANYTVIFWRQKASDDRSLNTGNLNSQKTYDFAGIETRSGTTGTKPSLKSTDTSKSNSGDYTGFKYLRNDADTQTIKGDGTTIVNVYYDRNLITMEFKVNGSQYSTSSYVASGASDANLGMLNGEYIELQRNPNTGAWYYQESYTVTVSETEVPYTNTGNVYYSISKPGSNQSDIYGWSNGSFIKLSYKKSEWRTGSNNNSPIYSDEGGYYKKGDAGGNHDYYGSVSGKLFHLNRYDSQSIIPYSGTIYRIASANERRNGANGATGYYPDEGGYLSSASMKGLYFNNGTWYEDRYLVVVTWFYRNEYSGPVYLIDNSNDGTPHFGFMNGEVTELHWDNVSGKWGTYGNAVTYTYVDEIKETRTRNVEYSGTRYKIVGQQSPFTGLYGQPLSMYGYSWPSEKVWQYSTTTMTFLGQFILPTPTNTSISFSSSGNPSCYVRFYLENEDGSWPSDDNPSDTGASASSGGNFSFSEKYDGYTVYQYNNGAGWKTASVSESATNNGSLRIRYARKSYSLSFYNVTNGTTFGTSTVKFGRGMTKATVASPSITEQAAGYRWDGKYYEDQACTVEFDFTKPMPSHSVIVYVQYVLPSYTVTFYSDTVTTHANELFTFDVTQGNSLDPIMADSYGNLLDEYKPTLTGYVFDGWYYRDGSAEKPFILSLGIRSNMAVYAKWKAEGEEEISTEKRDVTVRYLYKEDGTVLHDEIKRYDMTVGTTLALQAPDVDGYYAERMIWYHQVSESEDPAANTVTFYYQKIKPWLYTVEYYARYSSFETAGDEISEYGVEPQGQTKDYLISRTEKIEAYNQYESVSFVLPAGYENYHMDSYEYDGKTGTTTVLTIHPDTSKTALVKFYLEPDTTKLTVGDRYVTYNGTSQALLSETRSGEDASIKFPNSVTGLEKIVYRYYDGDKHPLDAADVVNAGTYRMNGYVIIAVSGKAVGDSTTTTRHFLLWKDTENGLSLRIGRRLITVESDSKTAKYAVGSVLTSPHVTVTYTGVEDGYGAFIGNEGADYIFAVDAFRMDPGSSTNTFTVVLWDGSKAGKAKTLASNYQITVKYGTLTVTEQ